MLNNVSYDQTRSYQKREAFRSDLLPATAVQQHHDEPIWPSCCTTTETQPHSDTVASSSFNMHVCTSTWSFFLVHDVCECCVPSSCAMRVENLMIWTLDTAIVFHRVNVMDWTFFWRITLSQSLFHAACSAPQRWRDVPRTDSIFPTLRARCAGHGARARARLTTDGSPVDSSSVEPSGAEVCHAMTSRKRPTGITKHSCTLLYKAALRRVGCFSRGDPRWPATGENYQSPSSGTCNMRAIPKERNIWR